MADDEQARQEVLRRFEVWGWQSAPARKYALLVAGYFRSSGGPYHGQPKCLCLLNGHGRALLELVEASADGRLTATERATADGLAHAAAAWEQSLFTNGTMFWIGSGIPECLHLALSNPHEAAGRMIGHPGALPEYQPTPSVWYPSVLRVMECLWPAAWGRDVAWTPRPEAVAWARRMYEKRNFAELRALADMLEAAGCPDRLLLDHCRNAPEHFRGCAALDRLLGADGDTPDRTDPLTGLANRRAFGMAVTEAAHRAGVDHTPLSVLALDLDGFGRINSRYGLHAGDRLLTEVAGFMRAVLDGHLLARTGGDRFGVLLRGHDLPAALQVAERLRRAVEVWRWDAPDLGIRGESLTITTGAAALDSVGGAVDGLVRAADDAFHRAEAAGRNRVSE